jgi:nitrogen fixation protein
MTIKVTYNTTDIYVSESISATYINVSYEVPSDGGGAVWGDITGTLSDQTDLQNALNAKFDDPTGTTAQYLRGDGTLATFPSLTGFVPYTGATTNVDLGEFELKAGQIELDTTPTGTASVAVTRWNDTNGVSETTLKGGSVVLKNGIDLVARVVNKVTPNATLTKAAYQAVRVSGAQGQRLAVAYAQANNDANSADTIGLVTETIATNQEGFIMVVGQLENINTTGSLQGETWVDGDVLYLSPTTAGAITKVKPTGNGHIVVIGYVEYAHVNNGKIYVKVMNGWELDELHDVAIVTPLNNEGLFYESATSLWKNKSIATALGYTPEQPLTFTTPLSRATNTISIPQATGSVSGFLSSTDWTTFNSKQNALTNPITGTAAAGQVAYFTGATTQAGSNNLFWNNANARLGVGTATPYTRIQSTSNIGASTTDFSNSTSTGSIVILRTNASTGNTNGILAVGNAGDTIVGDLAINPFGGNVMIGSQVSSGQRFQVTGDTLLKGSGNTSATTALLVENSDGTDLFTILNNGYTRYGNSGTNAFRVYPSSVATAGDVDLAGLFLTLNSRVGATETGTASGFIHINGVSSSGTSGIQNVLTIQKPFAPTSGTAEYRSLLINQLINQTGGANGITRGLYVNPTLTAAADWRSIEWSNNTGWGLYGSGTSNNYLGGRLGIGTFTSGVWSSYSTVLQVGQGFFTDYSIQPSFGIGSNIYYNGTNTIVLRTGGAGYLNFANNGDIDLGNGASQTAGATFTGTAKFKIFNNGNTLIQSGGTFTDSGQKLQVTGDTLLKGSGNTSATTALLVQNSDGGAITRFRNDGSLNNGGGVYSNTGTTSTNGFIACNPDGSLTSLNSLNIGVRFTDQLSVTSNGYSYHFSTLQYSARTYTSGIGGYVFIGRGFAPTSGTGVFNAMLIENTINQTGGANGITRGLYINPTLTSAADFRAIEVSAGTTVLAPSVTARASLRIPSGTAPTSPVNGDIWFDGTDLKMRIGGVTKTFTLI